MLISRGSWRAVPIRLAGGPVTSSASTPLTIASLDTAGPLEIGCVRGTERFLEHDPPLVGELEALRTHVRQLVAGAVAAHPELGGAAHLIGVAGTVAALVRLDQQILVYDRNLVHRAQLSLVAIERGN